MEKALSMQLQELAALDYNYDEKMYHASDDKQGWYLDKYAATLAAEPPGEPLVGGAFDAAKQTIRMYQFPNPHLIYAVFDPESELSGRNMLMFAKFAGFTFTFGVRVTSVVDEIRKDKGGNPVRVWGYAYRTLKGHFEIGEIRFEVSKNLTTGEVGFEIDAYSKPERIPNLFYRIGFRVFGRYLQRYFASSSIRRLQRISRAALEDTKALKGDSDKA